jgi:hypothetical protein
MASACTPSAIQGRRAGGDRNAAVHRPGAVDRERPKADEAAFIQSGSPFQATFTEAHILAITQAICEYRHGQGIDGPLYMGKDTHGISGPAQRTALEVLAANNVETIIQRDDGVTPTPVISRVILVYNRGRKDHLADGIVVTPSHNPPRDGGFKYNPPNGGPADTDVTTWIQNRANDLLRGGNKEVKRLAYEKALNLAQQLIGSRLIAGEVVRHGRLRVPKVGPMSSVTTPLPCPVPAGSDEVHLTVRWHSRRDVWWGPAGHLVSWDQVELRAARRRRARGAGRRRRGPIGQLSRCFPSST